MAAKIVLALCAQILLIQSISANCRCGAGLAALEYGAPLAAGPWAGNAWGYDALAYETPAYTPAALSASYGCGLSVESASPVAPTGVSVISENAIEGALAVFGKLPFLGTVGLEGALPTAGSSAVSYGSGNGEVGILSEDLAGVGHHGHYGHAGLAYGAGPAGLAYGAGPAGIAYGAGPAWGRGW